MTASILRLCLNKCIQVFMLQCRKCDRVDLIARSKSSNYIPIGQSPPVFGACTHPVSNFFCLGSDEI
jgi:hypothetical protein